MLRFKLEPEGLALDLTSIGAHAYELAPLSLTAQMEPPGLPAYGWLLLDVLRGDPALSLRGDEAEEAWRVLVLDSSLAGYMPWWRGSWRCSGAGAGRWFYGHDRSVTRTSGPWCAGCLGLGKRRGMW
ncbi:hypothetical protein [Streptomyces sp. NPDC048489]|uniref:hypothetical protein n=1 Tax=Streptomyces sp. NPDC048489 TaxID=3154504 RepID=UPI00343E53D2